MKEEMNTKDILFAGGKVAEGDRGGERNRRWRSYFTLLVSMILFPHCDPLVLSETLTMYVTLCTKQGSLPISPSVPHLKCSYFSILLGLIKRKVCFLYNETPGQLVAILSGHHLDIRDIKTHCSGMESEQMTL